MSENKEAKTLKKGGFFGVPINAIWHMIEIHRDRESEQSLEPEEILAYICLCRGAGRFASSGWTEHAIATYCNMTQSRAALACTYLTDNDLITRNEDYRAVKSNPLVSSTDSFEYDNDISDVQPKNRRHKYFLNCRNEGDMVYLPNCVVDGATSGKAAYPLSTLSKGFFFSKQKGVSSKEARLDAIILLLALYTHHDLQIYGGINRHLWSTQFTYVESGGGLGASPPISELWDTGYHIHEVERGEEYFQTSALSKYFSYISDDETRNRRTNAALKSLLQLRFIYEVLQVWTGSTLSGDSELELEYPLYSALVFPRDEVFNIGGGNQFRFVCDDERYGHLIGSLRMRYRPHDHDCGIGMNEQSEMVSNWTELLTSFKEEHF
jgi:hypothetical protein